ncbi:hypothetical protein K9N68_37190 (plasmid) [Kovacikia minuta CCNUW1]|uniref:hypothetical protein n=1 Tax=Kovacikia minuta TaxID=2931930 RepID=UPI001CCA3085|nr:hypothetical protein [Kovacikia minuta]UBF29848.1 hypothetical protein K9N68_37190 [Kovacikia minuta CCNUW1]
MFDLDFPTLLGAELLRPDGSYISKFVVQPSVVHDFNAFPGGSVQLDRYSYWDDNSFSEDNRRRNPNQIIGSTGSREIPKTKIIVTLDEFTGPSAGSDNPNDPGNLKIPIHNLITAQRLLYDMNNAQAFHQSIGSLTLVRDFRKWQDRVYINRLLTVTALGSASATQGGYWNPGGVLNAGTYGASPPRFDVTNDLLTVTADMRTRNVPPFPSPYGPVYHNLSSPVFLKHLRANSDFREVAKYPGAVPISLMQPGPMGMSAPMMPAPGNYMNAPNQMLFMGQGYGQVGFMSGDVMPTGFVFEGVRFFESTNLPTASITLTYTSAPSGITTGSAARTAFLGLFFGQQAVGEGVWGAGPEVKLNENSDYKRFLIAIWSLYAGYALLNDSFVTVARTYQN